MMKTVLTLILLIVTIKVGNPCMSTQNPWDTTTTTTTTTTATPMTCASCDLAALYSTEFCPQNQGCQYNYPLIQGAQLVNSSTPPCVKLQNICPPTAYLGVGLRGTEDVAVLSSEYAGVIDIECNAAGQWIANINDPTIGGLHYAETFTCFTRKSCATCDAAEVLGDNQICLVINAECTTPDFILNQFSTLTGCYELVIQCQGYTVLGLQDNQAVIMTNATRALSQVTCSNGQYLLTSPTANAVPILTAACLPTNLLPPGTAP